MFEGLASGSCGFIKPDWKRTIYRQKIDILSNHSVNVMLGYMHL